MEEFFYTSTKVLSLTVLVLAIFYAIKNFNRLPVVFKWLCFYLGITLVLEIVSELLIWSVGSNIPFFYVFALVEILFFRLFYLTFLTHKKDNVLFKKVILVIVLVIATSIIFEGVIYFLSGVSYFYGKLLSSLCIIIFSGLLFVKNIKSKFNKNVISFLPANIALLLYNSASLDVVLAFKYLMPVSVDLAHIIWGVNNVFSAMFYILTIIVFRKYLEDGNYSAGLLK